MDNESLEMTVSFNNKEEILNILHPLMNGLLHPYFVIEKNEELKSIFKDVNYNDYKILKTYNFQPLSENNTLYNALTFAYTKLTGDGMKSMSQIFLNMGIDGYIIDNVYVIINFDKLNKNIVKLSPKILKKKHLYKTAPFFARHN